MKPFLLHKSCHYITKTALAEGRKDDHFPLAKSFGISYNATTMAHKKAQGASRNNRDSQAQRLGVKLFGGEVVKAGNIIVRQRGSKMIAGDAVGVAKDYSLYALKDGLVKFSEKRILKFDKTRVKKTVVSVQ